MRIWIAIVLGKVSEKISRTQQKKSIINYDFIMSAQN
jgi:hypothetical protein